MRNHEISLVDNYSLVLKIGWPLKLKNKVMELVFEQVGTSTGDTIPVDSEKN